MPNKLVKVDGPNGNSLQISIPSSIIDKDGNITDNGQFEKIADGEFAKRFPNKNQQPNTPEQQGRGIIPSMEKTSRGIGPYNPLNKLAESATAIAGGRYKQAIAPAMEGIGGVIGDVSMAAIPELRAEAIPRILMSALGAGVGSQAGRLFSDPDNKRLASDVGGIIGGVVGMSPKLTGALGGAGKEMGRSLTDPKMMVGRAATAIMGRLGIPKGVIGGLEAASFAKPAYEGAKAGAYGKPWIPALFRSAISDKSTSSYKSPKEETILEGDWEHPTEEQSTKNQAKSGGDNKQLRDKTIADKGLSKQGEKNLDKNKYEVDGRDKSKDVSLKQRLIEAGDKAHEAYIDALKAGAKPEEAEKIRLNVLHSSGAAKEHLANFDKNTISGKLSSGNIDLKNMPKGQKFSEKSFQKQIGPSDESQEKQVVPETKAQEEANSNGISLEDHLKNNPHYIVKNRTEMMRSVHARAKAKGVRLKDMGLSNMGDKELHNVWQNMGELPDVSSPK